MDHFGIPTATAMTFAPLTDHPPPPGVDRRRNSHTWPLVELLPQPVLLIDQQRRLLASNSQARKLLQDGRMQVHSHHLTALAQMGSLQLSQLLGQALEIGGANMGIWFERDMTTGWLHITPTTPLATLAAGSVYREAVLLTVHLDQPALTQSARIDALARCCKLSPTERYVLMLLSDGQVVEAAARQLGVRISTVRSHVRSLLSKTQSPSLMQLLRWTGSAAALPH